MILPDAVKAIHADLVAARVAAARLRPERGATDPRSRRAAPSIIDPTPPLGSGCIEPGCEPGPVPAN